MPVIIVAQHALINFFKSADTRLNNYNYTSGKAGILKK